MNIYFCFGFEDQLGASADLGQPWLMVAGLIHISTVSWGVTQGLVDWKCFPLRWSISAPCSPSLSSRPGLVLMAKTEFWQCESSQSLSRGLDSGVTHCHLHHMLMARASYKASPVLSSGGINATFEWEELQSHIAKGESRGRLLLGFNTVYHRTHAIANCKVKSLWGKIYPLIKWDWQKLENREYTSLERKAERLWTE